MKPIIIEMRDMSDSTEVYESRPNPVFAGFIYLILAMVIVASVWAYVSKMDIVVKGTGTVAAAEDVATITNQVPGVILKRCIQDGQRVEAGEILYVVSHEEQDLQLMTLEKQLRDYEEKEEMLKNYEAWLETGTEFPAEAFQNMYYSEIAARKRLVELGQESALMSYSGELAAYDVKLDTNREKISYYEEAVSKSKQLIAAIRSRTNSFSSEETYYWNTVENYLVQYQQLVNQYDEKIAELQKQSSAAAKEIKELEKQKADLKKQLEEEPVVMSVSDGDASENEEAVWENQQALEQALKSVEASLTAQRSLKETADSGMTQCYMQKNAALNVHEKESVSAIESSILSYEQNLAAYEGTRQEYISSQNTLKEQGTEIQLGNLVTQEKHSVAGELENCRKSGEQLQAQIKSLEQSVENATVRATMSGTVNLVADLVEGDYLTAGTQVLSIIPDTDTGVFVVKSYVENRDIAKIQEGMEVTYEIGAYPSREYGTLRGKVTFVSADLKVNNSGSAYYVVETSVNAKELCNQSGEQVTLKVGMLCETKIVVEEKSVLEVLIEKLFHIGE